MRSKLPLEFHHLFYPYDVSVEKLSSVSYESCAGHVVLHEEIEKGASALLAGKSTSARSASCLRLVTLTASSSSAEMGSIARTLR